jgi:glutamate-ammonia-ligase adenylyltransferase
VLSDLDLIFLREAECAADEAEACAVGLLSTLSGYTREGSVIAVDTRLRPRGKEGELVVTPRQLAQYFESEAKAWEVLAFGKLRWIAGCERLADGVRDAVTRLRARFVCDQSFTSQLRSMRKLLEGTAGADSFKSGPGGLFDLDFLVGLLEARAGLASAGRQLNERLWALAGAQLLSSGDGEVLMRSAELFRKVDHAVRIVVGRSRSSLPESEQLRHVVAEVAGVSDLRRALQYEMRAVRSIFDSVFFD